MTIYYVSDRTQSNKQATLNTLDLPQVSNASVLLDTDAKEVRRQTILKTHRIIILFGNSLPDFVTQFKNKESTQAPHILAMTGVLPNAAYGAWSTAPLDGG